VNGFLEETMYVSVPTDATGERDREPQGER
jgi:hypothetical protein